MQRAALLQLYSNTRGYAWLNSSGWADASVALDSSMPELVPVPGSACLAMTANGMDATLPDHCCWFGVSCCTPDICADGRPSCSCTPGLVIGLDLGVNNVSVRVLPSRITTMVTVNVNVTCPLPFLRS